MAARGSHAAGVQFSATRRKLRSTNVRARKRDEVCVLKVWASRARSPSRRHRQPFLVPLGFHQYALLLVGLEHEMRRSRDDAMNGGKLLGDKHRHVAQRFTLERFARQVQELYDELLRAPIAPTRRGIVRPFAA